ncbi:HAD family hydrolase [Streptomyces sp. OE57]|uniref:HAD family hydrolase n=1 Tax=Streptomyces lacaronensis TaxID=3379885 RepID=UPI0039B77CF5
MSRFPTPTPTPTHSTRPAVRAVVFDIGGTVFDETRQWAGWARWLGVPEATFFAAFGSVIERGTHMNEVFALFDHGHIDPQAVRTQRMSAGEPDEFGLEDLHHDALSCFEELRACGYLVGLAGNQLEHRHTLLEKLSLPVDFIATSARWGVEKPDAGFFDRVARTCRLAPGEIAYVGDRVDHDVLPALRAGFVTVFVRRGPWGHIHARTADAERAHLRLDKLDALPGQLRWWDEDAS